MASANFWMDSLTFDLNISSASDTMDAMFSGLPH
jgi:hypothetical protein